jgi:hypothetical protein
VKPVSRRHDHVSSPLVDYLASRPAIGNPKPITDQASVLLRSVPE